jgi:hypothetical protein
MYSIHYFLLLGNVFFEISETLPLVTLPRENYGVVPWSTGEPESIGTISGGGVLPEEGSPWVEVPLAPPPSPRVVGEVDEDVSPVVGVVVEVLPSPAAGVVLPLVDVPVNGTAC